MDYNNKKKWLSLQVWLCLSITKSFNFCSLNTFFGKPKYMQRHVYSTWTNIFVILLSIDPPSKVITYCSFDNKTLLKSDKNSLIWQIQIYFVGIEFVNICRIRLSPAPPSLIKPNSTHQFSQRILRMYKSAFIIQIPRQSHCKITRQASKYK